MENKDNQVNYSFLLGERYELKKKHPCGSNDWEVVRTGADIKLKCLGCGHIVLIDRSVLKKSVKSKID